MWCLLAHWKHTRHHSTTTSKWKQNPLNDQNSKCEIMWDFGTVLIVVITVKWDIRMRTWKYMKLKEIYIFFRYLYVIEKYFGLKNPKSACNLWRPHCHYFRLISNKMRIFSNFHVPVTQDKTWFYYWLTKIEWIFELYFSHSERTRAFLLKQEVRPIRPIK